MGARRFGSVGWAVVVAGVALSALAPVGAQRGQPIGVPRQPIGDGPWTLDTAEQHKLRVSVVAKGLANPWSLAFLPDGSMLVTERPGRLRVIRDGVLDPTPISGVPAVKAQRLSGLMDVVLHPRFAENRLIYLTYSKPREDGMLATALARAKYDGKTLTQVKEIFVAEPWWNGAGGSASRVVFGRDGMLYMTTGSSGEKVTDGQDTTIHKGKILRLRDDGSVPPDNPFVGKAGFKPYIYTMGHRTQLALALNPFTGEMWSGEQGPNGGDEVNILKPGRNYGWPFVTDGRDYRGHYLSPTPYRDGVERPHILWVPSIAVSGMAFYTGDRFPNWRRNLFVGGLREGEIARTGQLQRIVFNDNWDELRRESLLRDLHQRIRDVRQGPDGNLYVLTEENDSAILKIEPAEGAPQNR